MRRTAEVLRRHQADGAAFYQWEKRAEAAMREALGKSVGGKPKRDTHDRTKERDVERMKAELDRKSRIIAEVVEETIALTKSL